MKKIWLAAAAALIVLYAAAAWLIGFSVEKRIDAGLDKTLEKIPYAVSVERHFRRGWFSSQEDLIFAAPNGLMGTVPGAPGIASHAFHLTVHSVIHHGPICGAACFGLAGVDTHIEFDENIQAAVAKIFGSMEPLRATSRLGFFGGGSTTFSSPPVADKKLSDGALLNWGGLTATVNYGAGFDSVAIHAAAPNLMVSGPDGKRFDAAAAAFDSHSRRALRSLYTGDSSFTLGRFALAGAGGASAATLADVRIASQVTADDGFATMSMTMGTGAISTAPVTLTGTHLDLAFRHLEMESLEQLMAGIRAVNQDRTLAPMARAGKMLPLFTQQGARLLERQPQIVLDRISFANANGEAVLKGLVQLRGVTAADFAAGADPKALVQKIDADLDLTIADALLKSLPGGANNEAQLQRLTDSGLLSFADGKFHTKILFHQGQATFNGKPFPPPVIPAVPAPPPPPMPHSGTQRK